MLFRSDLYVVEHDERVLFVEARGDGSIERVRPCCRRAVTAEEHEPGCVHPYREAEGVTVGGLTRERERRVDGQLVGEGCKRGKDAGADRKSTRLNSSH